MNNKCSHINRKKIYTKKMVILQVSGFFFSSGLLAGTHSGRHPPPGFLRGPGIIFHRFCLLHCQHGDSQSSTFTADSLTKHHPQCASRTEPGGAGASRVDVSRLRADREAALATSSAVGTAFSAFCGIGKGSLDVCKRTRKHAHPHAKTYMQLCTQRQKTNGP